MAHASVRRIALCGIFASALATVAAMPGGAATSGRSPTAGPPVTRLDVARPWISPRSGQTIVTFELARPGIARFALTQVAPICRSVGVFAVRGREGVNRFRFPGRIDRRLLPPGTYRLAARASERVRTVVVVAENRTTADARRRALGRDVCGNTATTRGVLGTTFVKSPEERSPLRPFVIGCLLLAIALLGVATLPAAPPVHTRASELLATHRPTLALSGGVALGVALALYVATLL
jgi:hypothetical protein